MEISTIVEPRDLQALLEFVIPYYESKDIMHDLTHIERVLKYVQKLVENVDVDVNKTVLLYGAYFHGFIYENKNKIKEWLCSQEISEDLISLIIKVAFESQKQETAETLEGKILHDAHMIEGGKTFLIVKSLITGSVRGQTLEQTISYIETNLLNKGTCYLEDAKHIFKEQQLFAKEFIKDLKEGLYK
ncbi:HD domain-containing protein [Haloplasma contractile]|uniref:HD domain-containing protein n=1 Tax=Haloplasma contractile SSD-17B TaxID=1033810 RepID=U2ED94_9MOLU|nr:hypothetical protein [Haloplasma contractile]ERJ10965.1 hypothetical protein HLPCO_003052 [Haloplasma contractile SSD-17B]ERJ12973.1 hypothetical protein HLPCO_000572 [Haloplasma contractile SSD-17B]